eukprot:CAMPEP_0179328910 /NCGR_PEP_ID=MMETSP0797-20121207/62818_1 /TAXON_ID=47934 /ORGANISM="Dinophysis acuminata, Strain DAEP01" /LENGTH=31 /DNA_ID= /DNA_START= /DNA_END= /DNA_ORIENTATION=
MGNAISRIDEILKIPKIKKARGRMVKLVTTA